MLKCAADSASSHMDPLDKAFTIFLPPKTEARPQPIHRRVDLIAAPYKYYWCAGKEADIDLIL